MLVIDGGTGIRRLDARSTACRASTLPSHLHMDHIQGLGFFAPLHDRDVETHIWGLARDVDDLGARLRRYLSPPLFPVRLRDPPRLALHALPAGEFVEAWSSGGHAGWSSVCHPGFTVGLRVVSGRSTLAYLFDHEPALGVAGFPLGGVWTSGHDVAHGADLLLHDSQYSIAEYAQHVGWGHSALDHTLAFARLAAVKHLVTFHHDPWHGDDDIDRLTAEARARVPVACDVDGRRRGRGVRASLARRVRGHGRARLELLSARAAQPSA
ncbi:MAG: MBL fold metallo-hydrolase [Candidatus Binatia bacterium]